MTTVPAPRLTYNAEGHVYRIGGTKVPGITTLLALSGYYKNSEWYTQKSSQRGTAVHLACWSVDEHCPDAVLLGDVLEVLDLGPALHPYIAGYLQFKAEHGFRSMRHEFQVCSERMHIAATPDLYGSLPGGKIAVVELKTWAAAPPKCQRSAEVQTACQDMLCQEHLQLAPASVRMVVALTGDLGRPYRSYKCDNRMDYAIVQSMASVFWDRVNNGLIEWDGKSEAEEEE